MPVRPESSASTIEGAARQPLVGGLSREQGQTPAENIAYFYSDVATPPAGHCGPARGCKGPAGAAHRRRSSQGELRTGQTGRKQPFTEVQLCGASIAGSLFQVGFTAAARLGTARER